MWRIFLDCLLKNHLRYGRSIKNISLISLLAFKTASKCGRLGIWLPVTSVRQYVSPECNFVSSNHCHYGEGCVCECTSCAVISSLTADVIPPCQRQDCHHTTRLVMCPRRLAEGLMGVFMVVSQLAGNNLRVTSGPRRRPTCWAAPWRSCPPPSTSTKPKALCQESAPYGSPLRRTARETQV